MSVAFSLPEAVTAPGGVSPGFVPGETSGAFAGAGGGAVASDGLRVDLHRLRVVFPDRWSAFLRGHFRDRVQVAYVFGVDERTARNWWDGVSSPRAEVALIAVSRFPAALPFFLRAA